MKRKVFFVISVFMTLALFCLTGCDVETSGFKATTYVQTNTSTSAHMKFGSLEGGDDFTLKAKGKSPKTLKYTGKLGSGSATVYYETDGEKKELFTIKGGENVDSSAGEFTDATIKLYFETNEKCKDGKFDFELE